RAWLPATDRKKKLGRPLDAAPLSGRIDAAFETHRRVGVHAVAARPARDRVGSKECGLEKYVARRVGDGGGLPAHDAGETDSAAAVGNHEHVRAELERATVE